MEFAQSLYHTACPPPTMLTHSLKPGQPCAPAHPPCHPQWEGVCRHAMLRQRHRAATAHSCQWHLGLQDCSHLPCLLAANNSQPSSTDCQQPASSRVVPDQPASYCPPVQATASPPCVPGIQEGVSPPTPIRTPCQAACRRTKPSQQQTASQHAHLLTCPVTHNGKAFVVTKCSDSDTGPPPQSVASDSLAHKIAASSAIADKTHHA